MTHTGKTALALSVLALGVAPAFALAAPQTAPPGHGQGHHGKPAGSPGNGPKGTTGHSGATGNTGMTGDTGNKGKGKGHSKPYTVKPPKGHAYGYYCQGESKHHVSGMKGTPFSQCVTAMAHLHNGSTTNPARACKSLSKKHVAGTHGTPYSQCVSAGRKYLTSTTSS